MGIKAIIAQSFAEIFISNCQAMGLPCFTVSESDCETLWKAAEANHETDFTMDIDQVTISFADQKVEAQIPSGFRQSLLQGTWDATQVLLQAEKEIEQTAANIPYMNQFK